MRAVHKDTIQKIKNLYDKSEGGEKQAAKEALDRLLEKHSISLDELEQDFKEWREFKFKRIHKDLVFGLMAHMFGIKSLYKRISDTNLLIETTISEFLEFNAKLDFYTDIWDREQKKFARAFFIKHKLFATGLDDYKMTAEDIKNFMDAQKMSNSMSNTFFGKNLNQTSIEK